MSHGVTAWIVLVSVGGVSGSFFTDQRPLPWALLHEHGDSRTATTESVSLRADEKLTAFLEEPCAVVFNRAQKVTALDERAALA